jgi:DNA-binding NarL/FixJ family response regulator
VAISQAKTAPPKTRPTPSTTCTQVGGERAIATNPTRISTPTIDMEAIRQPTVQRNSVESGASGERAPMRLSPLVRRSLLPLSSIAQAIHTPYHPLMSEQTTVRVLLVDDHDLLRRGIKTMLESEGLEVVGEAADGTGVLQQVEELLPDVVLIDVIMPNKDGIEATREMKDSFPNVGVVVLSGHDDQQFVFDALKAGASGYLLKTAELDEVVTTVRAVAAGEGRLDPVLAGKVLSEFQSYQKDDVADVYQPLTPREREILNLMSEGLPNKTIANRLSISERTVTTHVANIYSKLHVNNRVSAIQEAMRRRILSFNQPG